MDYDAILAVFDTEEWAALAEVDVVTDRPGHDITVTLSNPDRSVAFVEPMALHFKIAGAAALHRKLDAVLGAVSTADALAALDAVQRDREALQAERDTAQARIEKLEGLLRQASGILQCVAYAGPGRPQILADISTALKEGT